MSKHDDVPDVGDGDDEQFDTFKINMQGVNETAKAPRRSLRKMFSVRGSMLSRELQDGCISVGLHWNTWHLHS